MMKLAMLPVLALLALTSACDKDETMLVMSETCRATAQVDGWETMAFKRASVSDADIQLPSEYEGPGLAGFEGRTFRKARPDGSVRIEYAYCSPTFCEPFGKTLARPLPATVVGRDTSFRDVGLARSQVFCAAGDTVGVLYTNDLEQASGRYFMEVGGGFREAADVQFAAARREEVEQIVGTIKAK